MDTNTVLLLPPGLYKKKINQYLIPDLQNQPTQPTEKQIWISFVGQFIHLGHQRPDQYSPVHLAEEEVTTL